MKKTHKEEEMLLRTVESIIEHSTVNLYFMTAFHPSSKQQVDEQILHMLKPPNPRRLLIAVAPPGWATLNLLF